MNKMGIIHKITMDAFLAIRQIGSAVSYDVLQNNEIWVNIYISQVLSIYIVQMIISFILRSSVPLKWTCYI